MEFQIRCKATSRLFIPAVGTANRASELVEEQAEKSLTSELLPVMG